MPITYQQVTMSTLRYLQCVTVNHQSVVFTKPSIHCDSAEYNRWRPMVILLLLLDVWLVPCWIGWLLWTHCAGIKKRLLQDQTHRPLTLVLDGIEMHQVPPANTVLNSPSTPSTAKCDSIVPLEGLYGCYAAHAFWIKPLVMLSQVMLVILEVSFSASHSTCYFAYTCFNMAVFCFHVMVRPYRRQIDNNFEYASLLLLCLVPLSILSDIAHSGTGELSTGEQVFLFLLVIPFTIVLLVHIVFLRIRTLWARWRMKQKESSARTEEFGGDAQRIAGLQKVTQLITSLPEETTEAALDQSAI